MNVLIVASNRNRQPLPVMPYGACVIAEAAERAGHNVSFLDLMWRKCPLCALKSKLETEDPDVVGISVRNIDNNNMLAPVSYAEELVPMVRTIRNGSNAIVVLGGPGASLMPEEFLRRTGADGVFIGNAETTFPEFLDAVECKKNHADIFSCRSISGIPNIGWIENGEYRQTRSVRPDFPSGALVPKFPRFLDMPRYESFYSPVPIQTKRGCPFECVYCTYAKNEGRAYQLANPADVAFTVRRLYDAGIKDIEFVDNIFNSPYEHALEICEEIAATKAKPRLQTVELNPRFLDEKLLGAMERAGFAAAGITAESASDAVLDGLGKGFGAADVERAAEAASKSRISFLWIFLVGGPGETLETFEETLEFAKNRVSKKDTVFFNVGIRIYPGTRIEKIAREEGVLEAEQSEMLDPVSYFSPELDLFPALEILKETTNRRMNFISIDSFDIPYLGKICNLGHMLGVKPPIWKYTSKLRFGLRLVGANV